MVSSIFNSLFFVLFTTRKKDRLQWWLNLYFLIALNCCYNFLFLLIRTNSLFLTYLHTYLPNFCKRSFPITIITKNEPQFLMGVNMGLEISWCKRMSCLNFILRSVSVVRNLLSMCGKQQKSIDSYNPLSFKIIDKANSKLDLKIKENLGIFTY